MLGIEHPADHPLVDSKASRHLGVIDLLIARSCGSTFRSRHIFASRSRPFWGWKAKATHGPPAQLLKPPIEFRTLHVFILGQICPSASGKWTMRSIASL